MSERAGAGSQQKGGWRQWTSEQAQRELKAWRRSGMALEPYARKRGFGAQRLRWWRDRLETPSRSGAGVSESAPNLVPAIIAAPLRSTHMAPVTLRMDGGLTVEIADVGAVSAEWVAGLVTALARASR